MGFVYDKNKLFSKKVNSETVVWQIPETDYWKDYLKSLIKEHVKYTGSEISKNILNNFENELNNFLQVCPKEMLDKLDNPISTKSMVNEVS